jgi:phosphate transport system permease protein
VRRALRSGDPFIWVAGGALAASLLMVAGLVLLILVNGLGFFWPRDLVRLTLADGRSVLGEVAARERIPAPGEPAGTPPRYRIQVKQGNRDLTGSDFLWIDEDDIRSAERPSAAVAIERLEWGNLYGTIEEVSAPGVTARGEEEGWRALRAALPEARRARRAIRRVEKDIIGAINHEQESIRLRLRRLEMRGESAGEEAERLRGGMEALERRYAGEVARLDLMRRAETGAVTVASAGGERAVLPLSQVVRAYRPNDLGPAGKCLLYAARGWEFLADEPRESNTEGGVFPAIFGTVMMVFIMSLLVSPLGVVAAFYLREYARQGPFVSAVRIAVNNLAGVPSIVFGVFGVGFFIYFIGGGIDRIFFSEALPRPTFGTGGILWASLTLALLTVPVVIVATEEGLAAIPGGMREASIALGATKFETTWRVVLPAVMPSILTGLILAMARAAGEVAPLMITGVVKLAPSLPIDGYWPFVHLDRKFMHLGFHIYDVGFQSPNVDAARPMVYTTTVLLIIIVLLMNLGAVSLRNRLRRKYSGSSL